MSKPPTPATPASTLKAFFGASAALQAVRQNLGLTPNEQFLALSLALISHCAEIEVTPEQAIRLLKTQFKTSYSSAKAGKAKPKEGAE